MSDIAEDLEKVSVAVGMAVAWSPRTDSNRKRWDEAREALQRVKARVAELEAEYKLLRECADAMADAIEEHFKPEDQVILYRATFPREEVKHG